MELEHGDVTKAILGRAIAIHRELGPGLLESVYEECLAVELDAAGLSVRRQVNVPITFRGRRTRSDLRIDLLVAGRVVVEVKSVDRLMPIHEAQLLTYMRLASMPVGLLLNFNVRYLPHGLIRRVLSER